jgi:hypothetical protein
MATLYWGPSGGSSTGTWNAATITNWFTDIGRITPSLSAPTLADDVVFDGSSDNSAIFTVTIGAGATCKNLTISGLDRVMTWAINAEILIYGSLNISPTNLTRSGFGFLTFKSTSLGNTITTGGLSFTNRFTFDGVGGSWILQDNVTNTQELYLTNGLLDLNNKSISANIIVSSNSNVRSIAFGATGSITLTANATNIMGFQNATNFSYTGTSSIICNYAGATGGRNILFGSSSGGTEANALNINVTAGTDVILFSVVKNITLTGFTGTITNASSRIYGNLTIPSGVTYTANANAMSFSATSGIQQVTTNSVVINGPITQDGVGGTVQLQDNLTIGATRTYTFTAGDLHINNRTLSTGLFSSSNSNVRVIDFKSGNITTTGSGTVWTTATTTNFSYLGTPTVNISNNSATATTVSTGAMTAAQALNFNYTTGTYTLTDTAAVYKTVNFTGFAGTIPNSVRTIHGGATFSAGMTLTAGANVTTFAAISGTNNITTNAKTLDFPIIFNGIGGTWAFQDALTQGSTRAFTITNGTVQLKSSATSTTGAFATSGTNQKFLQSTTPGTQATLTQASGTVNASYLTIQDINAIGGATWFAPISQLNVDAGNNDGWDFFIQLGEYMYTRRKNKRLLINY